MKILISFLILLFFNVRPLYAESLEAIYSNNEGVSQIKQALEERRKKEGFWKELVYKSKSLYTGIIELFDTTPDVGLLKGRVAPQAEKTEQNIAIDEKVLIAQQKFLETLGEESFSAKAYLNLGLSYELLGNKEKAYKSYSAGLEYSNKDKLLEFLSFYNMARVKGEQKEYDKALEHYQSALEIVPESKEIKTNIELLIQDQQGKGKSKNKNNKDKDKKDKKDPNQDQKDKKDQDGQAPPKPQKKEFKSKDLKKEDVKKIMEEIKSQEQKIRAREFGKKRKDPPRDKDW